MSYRILVVDDAASKRAMLRDALVKLGHQVIAEAKDGSEAVEQFKAARPDLVFLDITMPVMTGDEALKHILEEDPKAVVIMVSAMGQQAVTSRCVEQGAKSFLVKPYRIGDVKEVIEVAFA